jgi:uncharacterized protein YjaZ
MNACAERQQTVRFLRSETYTFSATEQRRIEAIADAAIGEARSLLPSLVGPILLTVRTGTDVIEETGETGAAMPPDAIMWTVDPRRHGGVDVVAQKWLRASLLHELHHLARAASQPRTTLLDQALFEGMATVFERDVAGADAPWGRYPANVSEWANELTQQSPDASIREWLYTHRDGRRWIGMKVGAYWVDTAMKKSGRSIKDLTTASTDEVLALAGVEPP